MSTSSGLAAFRSVTLHGNVLPADALTRAADLGMPGQTPDDYALTPGLAINAAVARSWNDLLVAWERRQNALETARGENATRLTRERWLLPLLSELGYGRIPALPAGLDLPPGLGETKPAHYPISHQLAWPSGDPTPSAAIAIHLLGDDIDLDKRTTGLTARAPHGMLQEFCNRSHTHLYGIVANGRTIRLLRDASSLAKQAYVEFDLDLMFREQLFADFRLLWLTLHATRLTPRTQEPTAGLIEPSAAVDADEDVLVDDVPAVATGPRPDDCWLENWRTQAISDGSRARELLEAGVARAITALGTGFVSHPDNDHLRTALADNPNTDQDLRRWLLRLVYRYIVLFVAEDRELLHPIDNTPAGADARTLYRDHFSTARLRNLAATRNGTRHSDLWDAHQIVTRALGTDGSPELALPPLASSLYDPDGIGLLSTARITNRYLLEAIRHLSQVRDKRTGNPVRVDYRNLDSEELGGVYEGLLAYVPRYDPAARTFTLATTAGSDRKTSGSYYTPSSLISLVLDETLDPLIDEALRAPDAEQAILNLTVCDPACGSGHFLVAAARRLARALATARTGDPEPSPTAVRDAMRDVVSRCIYGVDLNDLAIEVAKVALWLEALTPGKPFVFLDHHLKVGNALLGTTPKLLAGNIPDEAFTVLEGDDKAYTGKLKARNKAERRHAEAEAAGQLSWDICTLDIPTVAISKRAHDLDTAPADSINDVRARADAWRKLDTDPDLESARLVHDAWCAAFVQEKRVELGPCITHGTLTNLRRNSDLVSPHIRKLIEQAARQYRFFHWHLEFPGIFTVPETGKTGDQGWTGGFRAILGNPPWEGLQFFEEEYFAAQGLSEVVAASTAAGRRRRIDGLRESDPVAYESYLASRRVSSATVHALKSGGRFPLTGAGRLNTYALFAEHFRVIVNRTAGMAGILTPTGIATDQSTAAFFSAAFRGKEVRCFYDFINGGVFFPAVDTRFRFALTVVSTLPQEQVRLAFKLRLIADLAKARIALLPEDVVLVNPNTGTLPIFGSVADAELSLRLYRRHPVLVREVGDPHNPWGLTFAQGLFNMTSDSYDFVEAADLADRPQGMLPLYEGKHIWLFDHRYATSADTLASDKPRTPTVVELARPDFEISPRYYVHSDRVERALASRRWDRAWFLGFRDITNGSNERTFICSIVPRSGVGNVLPLAFPEQPEDAMCLLAAWGSLAFDYVARQKAVGTHMNFYLVKQLACPGPNTFDASCPWQSDISLREWTSSRVLELMYTSDSMAGFAADMGDSGRPFVYDAVRRQYLRAELDAAMFHAYGMDRGEVAHVLGAFPLLRQNQERELGEFRTEKLVLQAYDLLAAGLASDFMASQPQSVRHP